MTAAQGVALPFGECVAPLEVVELDVEPGAGPDVTAAGWPASGLTLAELANPALVLAREGGRPRATFLARAGSTSDDLMALAREQVAAAPRSRLPEPTDMPSVSVVVTTIAASEELDRVLEDLAGQTLAAGEVIVVDNRPATSGVRQWLSDRLEAQTVRYLAEAAPGLARARNAGLAAAAGDVVAFLDDDLRLDRTWLERLAHGFAPGIDCVTGLLMPLSLGTAAQLLMEQFGGFSKGVEARLYDLCEHRDPSPLYPFSVGIYGSGANAAFRADTLRSLGGFDPALGTGRITAGGEDLDVFLRIVLSGRTLAYQPEAVAWHRHEAELDQFERRVWGYGLGLGAVLGKHVMNSTTLGQMLCRAPAAARHLWSPASPKNAQKGSHYPTRYSWLECMGILLGPWAYLIARTADALRGVLQCGPGLSRPGARPRSSRHLPGTPSVLDWPMWCTEVDVAHRRSGHLRPPVGNSYRSVRVLIRHRGEPLGYVQLPLIGGGYLIEDALAAANPRLARRLESARKITGSQGVGHPGAAADDPFVTVAVCTRDRGPALVDCLWRLRSLSYPLLEILIIDNAPSDGSTREVFDATVGPDHRFRYVLEPRPGLSQARNRALREATGRILAFTDDDVAVDAAWVDGLVKGFARSPRVGCVTGLVCTAAIRGLPEAYFDGRIPWGRSCEPRLYGWSYDRADPLFPYSPGRFGTGANFAVRTDMMRSLGGFDTALGAGTPTRGGEDLDAFVRIVLAGRDIAYEPAALVWHHHRADLGGLRRQMFGYGSGLAAFAVKHLLDRSTCSSVVRRVPRGVVRLIAMPDSGVQSAEPRPRVPTLRLVEWAGLLWGPVLYLRARRQGALSAGDGAR